MTLREYRKQAGLTLEQLARVLQVHISTLQRWETGDRLPDAVEVAAIEQLTEGAVRAASFKRRRKRREPKARRAATDGDDRALA